MQILTHYPCHVTASGPFEYCLLSALLACNFHYQGIEEKAPVAIGPKRSKRLPDSEMQSLVHMMDL